MYWGLLRTVGDVANSVYTTDKTRQGSVLCCSGHVGGVNEDLIFTGTKLHCLVTQEVKWPRTRRHHLQPLDSHGGKVGIGNSDTDWLTHWCRRCRDTLPLGEVIPVQLVRVILGHKRKYKTTWEPAGWLKSNNTNQLVAVMWWDTFLMQNKACCWRKEVSVFCYLENTLLFRFWSWQILLLLLIIIIQRLYSAMGSYWDTEALVAPVKTCLLYTSPSPRD